MDSKKVDKWLMIISGILLILGSILFYFNGAFGGNFITQAILVFIGTILISFSASYLVLSLLIEILQLIFKKLSNHFKAEVWFKIVLSIIITIVVSYIIENLPKI